MRGHEKFITWPKCFESVHHQQGVEGQGNVGVARPPGDAHLHVGHLDLRHGFAAGLELDTEVIDTKVSHQKFGGYINLVIMLL